jgi:hypothetical protein
MFAAGAHVNALDELLERLIKESVRLFLSQSDDKR